MSSSGDSFNLEQPNRQPRPKSSILESFMHRRQASTGTELPAYPLQRGSFQFPSRDNSSAIGSFAKNDLGALGELQQNQQEHAARIPRHQRPDSQDEERSRSQSPTKLAFGNNIFISANPKESKKSKARDASPKKPKKTKSGSNLAGLLRPRSLKNLHKFVSDDSVNGQEDTQMSKDKENRTPVEPLSPPPPIFAQFTSDPTFRPRNGGSSMEAQRNVSDQELYMKSRPNMKERPKSFAVPMHAKTEPVVSPTKPRVGSRGSDGEKPSSKTGRSRVLNAFTLGHGRSKSTSAKAQSSDPTDQILDRKHIDKHLEAMLDRRNIPENQRYKMRNLTDTIKMEFIRQDWAEMQAARSERPGSTDSRNSADAPSTSASRASNDEKQIRSRGKSFTLTRGKKESKEPSSPTKKTREGTLGRHFRSKSTDSVVSESGTTPSGTSSNSSLLSKIKIQQGPADYVAYLRKVQKPELVEVGKVHKLRLLLRNETVAWIEEFIQQGGMTEIVGLLNRVMEVEWREEHEDALLHENLLCLKALSTTARAMQHLHSIQGELFPKLLHLLFDPEKKGPSEFTTRNIITSILFTYIESASPVERIIRAKSVLAHLRDPEPKDDERPVPFVLEMRRERPYRVWCKEVVNVTKEVFWIFLHNVNVVPLQADQAFQQANEQRLSGDGGANTYLARHFPQERPPVPAAPYVGGVEWDATNYLASHLDLMNAIIACTPTAKQRNDLREAFQISGWERCLGGSLRLCKEKFYGSVHDGLRTWVAAAAEDGWSVKDVRYGPPPESRSPVKKSGAAQKKKVEEAPKIEIPKLDFGLDKPSQAPQDDGWL